MSYIDYKEFKASDHVVDLAFVLDDTAGVLRKGTLVGIKTSANKLVMTRRTHATGPAEGAEGEEITIPVTVGEESRFRVGIDSVYFSHAGSETDLGLVTEVDTENHKIKVTNPSTIASGDPIYVKDGSEVAIGILDEDGEGAATIETTRKMKKVLMHGFVYKASLQNYYSEADVQLPLIKFI